MTAQKGQSLVIKAEDTAGGDAWTTIAGLRTTSFSVNNESVDITNKDTTSKWRQLLEGAGVSSLSISGAGVFTDSAVEDIVRVRAFTPTDNIWNYQIVMPNGDEIEGAFLISSYERAGEHNGEETYSLSLESAGDITFTAA